MPKYPFSQCSCIAVHNDYSIECVSQLEKSVYQVSFVWLNMKKVNYEQLIGTKVEHKQHQEKT